LKIKNKLVTSVAFTVFSPLVSADFIEDSTAALQLKNAYFNRDFRDGSSDEQSMRKEWGQGFTLNLKSGFTDGAVGFGLDAVGMFGLALSDGPKGSGNGLLSRGSDGKAYPSYSKAMITAKARAGKSDLLVGGVTPMLPLLLSNTSRLFPQIYNGALYTSTDVKDFAFHLGRVDKVKQRDSTNFERLTTTGLLGSFRTNIESDSYTFGGVDYEVSKNVKLSLHMSELKDFYRREFYAIKANMPLGEGNLFSEARYFNSNEVGSKKLGHVDNQAFSSIIGYSYKGHSFTGGYQKISGDSAFTYVGGSNTSMFSESLVSLFVYKGERSYNARYSFDFAAVGVPGLVFTARYIKGDSVDSSILNSAKARALNGKAGHEWERTEDLTYFFQSGPLSGLSLRWVHASNRANFNRDADEHRLISSYTFKF
jgi:hypothetical protein